MSGKLPKIAYSILKDAEINKDLAEILEKYKSSNCTKEEINLRIEVDKVAYVIGRCLSKLNVLVSIIYFTIMKVYLLKYVAIYYIRMKIQLNVTL